jgi:GMP synthase (glutamine-hydrolysing)
MILLISTCKDKLSEEEFVRPVSNLIGVPHEIKHYSEDIYLGSYDKIIICGTALMDNSYLEEIEKFNFLKDVSIPILGICSGMQIISIVFGSRLAKSKEIGMIRIELVKTNSLFQEDLESYALHGNSIEPSDEFEILAKSDRCVQAIKHKRLEIYGMMFHPEVRNPQIIRNFFDL